MRADPRQRPFRFGVLAAGEPDDTAGAWLELARRLEGEGCSTLLVGDHFLTPRSCTARLAAAAAVTSALRLGSYVYCNDFRHPALLAKEAAELDRISDGRLELGIGAGWLKEEYDMIGIPFDEGRVRADRFQEAVGLVRRLLAGETVTHNGEHYMFDEYASPVRPVQNPVPLLLGGGGPRMTRFAARNADIIGFDPMSLPQGDKDPREFHRRAFEEKVAVLDELSAARDDGGPERSIIIFDVGRSLEEMPDETWTERPALSESPYALIGEPAAVAETLLERRERYGLTYYVCFESDYEFLRPVIALLVGR
jgi:probable F420-dependent oxidoreductase